MNIVRSLDRNIAGRFSRNGSRSSRGPLKAILVQLLGGLGNQMFQYAAARAVSLRCNAPLILDGSWLSGETQRHFALWPFRIKAEIIESARFRSQLNLVCWRFAQRLNRRFGTHKLGARVYREKSFRYDSRAQSLEAPVYMYGYFQSEKYFADCRNIIFDDFQISDPPSPKAQALLDHIKACDAICMHVRRGDYVTDPTVNAFHGVCPIDYYHRGLQETANNLTRPECFVFSDDPVWVRDNLKLKVSTTIVDIHGPDEAHEDLRLMAACHSYVIANSSMSWWGAWLGRRPGKRVVAPRQWFQAASRDARDLIPNDWARL
jgi:Glycosyl transferase family 11